jgi:hypothetical protein
MMWARDVERSFAEDLNLAVSKPAGFQVCTIAIHFMRRMIDVIPSG